MTLKRFISFIGGVVFTALIYGLIIYIVVFATFSLAGENLNDKENRDALFFYISVAVSSLTLYVIFKRLKTKRKFSGAGITIPLLFAFYVCFVTGQVYWENLRYRESFDQVSWMQAQFKPFKMAKTMVKDGVLTGQTKRQIIDKLGITENGMKNERIDYLKYPTDKGAWELRLYFRDDKVYKSYLYEEGLGI